MGEDTLSSTLVPNLPVGSFSSFLSLADSLISLLESPLPLGSLSSLYPPNELLMLRGLFSPSKRAVSLSPKLMCLLSVGVGISSS
jgi:hypothetical protein